jgi:anthraniloyl-CoA monooxygenase
MRVGVIGGGPGGLYFASLLKRLAPEHDITVWERNAATHTYGFGLVFSDLALDELRGSDTQLHAEVTASGMSWDAIRVRHRGKVVTATGHNFTALPRDRLLAILQRRCIDAGVALSFATAEPRPVDLAGYDVVVAADGAYSGTRNRLAAELLPSFHDGRCAYLWLAVEKASDAFEFHVIEFDGGVFQLHCYPHESRFTTAVVEALEGAWEAAGLADSTCNAAMLRRMETLFVEAFGGARMIGEGSRRRVFRRVVNKRWWHGNTVLIGDAAHTTHFSIGSGTKLAFEDAAALAYRLVSEADVATALKAYEIERKPAVESAQRAAQASQEWFEDMAQYTDQEALQFAFNLLTRSRRVTYANLERRDPAFSARIRSWYHRNAVGRPAGPPRDDRPPMFVPIRLRELELPNRVMLSPMSVYSAQDGAITDFHLVHLGSKALGGAGLVMTEMTAVSANARITPYCAGLYQPEHEAAYRRLTDFIHDNSNAKIGIQLGHAGRKGATRPAWEGVAQPLKSDGWPLLAPSPLPYLPHSPVPAEMTRGDMDLVLAQFVAATEAAERVGFDLLELQCAHGFLLSSFLTPLSNHRTDAYGGSLHNRLQYPLEVFRAVRAVWPAAKPMTVRISATDWMVGGVTADDAVLIAGAFVAAGADAIDVSTGETSPDSAPPYDRSYQVPFADRIRNKLRVPTIAVGAISSHDDANSILLAGRADICAIGRAFLHDPAWVLHAGSEQEFDGTMWPIQFLPGRRRPPGSRDQSRTLLPRHPLPDLLDSARQNTPAQRDRLD